MTETTTIIMEYSESALSCNGSDEHLVESNKTQCGRVKYTNNQQMKYSNTLGV